MVSPLLPGSSSSLPGSSRLRANIDSLEEEYYLIGEKLQRLRKAYAIETDPAHKFKLEKQIEESEHERVEIEQKINSLAKEIDQVGKEHLQEEKISDSFDESMKIILSDAQKIQSFSELAKLSDPKRFLPLESANYDLSTEGSVILRLREISTFVKNSISTGNTYVKENELLKLRVSVLDLRDDRFVKNQWYAPEIQELSAKWLEWVDQEIEKIRAEKEEFREIPNPFIYGPPVRPDTSEVFVGRTDIIEKIEKLVFQNLRIAIFLYGRRRTGKTSALLNLNRFISNKVIPVFIDLQNLKYRESSYSFCYNVCRQITRSIPGLKSLLSDLDFKISPFTAFSDFLDKTEELVTTQDKLLLLTFDEYERLGEEDKNILDTLRSIIQHRTKIVVLISGAHHFEEISTISWSDYLINTKMVEIGYLDQESGLKLITNPPVERFDLTYQQGVPERILEITHCQPFLLQAIASELVNYLNSKRHKRAKFEDLENILPTVLISAEAYFQNVWEEECDDEGRKLLKLLVEKRDAMSSDSSNDGLRALLRKGVLEQENNTIKIVIPLFERWIREIQLMKNT